jgi:hypothetical protein
MSTKTCRTKVCPKCGKRKRREAFSEKRNGYLMAYCKPCSTVVTLQWQKDNRERHNENTRRWRRDNPERHKESKRLS